MVYAHISCLHFKNSPQKQKELQTLLLSGQDFVAERISLIAQLRDSHPYLKDTVQDIPHPNYRHKLVYEFNRLSDMEN